MTPWGRDGGQVVCGSGGNALPGQLLVAGSVTGHGHVDDDGTGQPETLHERVLKGHQAGGRMDDLDAHGLLPQRAVQQATDLEAAHAEALADGVLGEVPVVVELGSAKHQARVSRHHRRAGPRGRGDGHAHLCRLLLICR